MPADRLSDVLDSLGLKTINVEDVREAIILHKKQEPLNANFMNKLMEQILADKPAWQLGVLETLDTISEYLQDR